MRFISGLKNLSKKSILLFVVILFIVSWFLFIFAVYVISSDAFGVVVLIFVGFLAVFTFILLIFSIIIPIDKMGKVTIIIAAVLTIPIMWIFSGLLNFLIDFSFYTNLFIIAFFAFKFSMDSAKSVDNYFYKKKGSRKFTRVLEFILFLILYFVLLYFTVRFFRNSVNPAVADVFLFLFWFHLILLLFVLLKLLFTQKLAAYIPLFFLLTFIFVLYLVIDLWATIIFSGSSGYSIFYLIIDLFIFLYIIGSIMDRVDYIKDKIKIFRAGTIALFVILIKSIVQLTKIVQGIVAPTPLELIFQVQVLFYFFVIFTLLIGLYTIFFHKEGKKEKKYKG